MTAALEAIEAHSARLEQAGVCFGQGTTNAFDEAAWLALWSLGLPLDALDEHAAPNARRCRASGIAALVDRRIATRQPAAYLTREAWLQGVAFYVDERAIVPRSLIAELLADGALDAWLLVSRSTRARPVHRQRQPRGAGGAGLAGGAIDAADVSADALAVARINVERHGLAERIALLHGDGLAAVRGPLRPDPVQPAVRQRARRWRRCRPSFAPSRR